MPNRKNKEGTLYQQYLDTKKKYINTTEFVNGDKFSLIVNDESIEFNFGKFTASFYFPNSGGAGMEKYDVEVIKDGIDLNFDSFKFEMECKYAVSESIQEHELHVFFSEHEDGCMVIGLGSYQIIFISRHNGYYPAYFTFDFGNGKKGEITL